MMHIDRGDGVASIKRRRRDLSSDDVKNLTTASGRNRLKSDLEDLTWYKSYDPTRIGGSTHDIPRIEFEVLRYDLEKNEKQEECRYGIELTLEQSQTVLVDESLVSIEGVEELKRNVWIYGEKKETLHAI
ncbi:hypothetical protein Tco_0468847 [Tanacetum coccineum]